MKLAYVFDMDGTLADSMPIAWGKGLLRFLDERNIRYPDDIIKRVIALGIPGMANYYKEHFDIPETTDGIIAWFMENLQPLYENEVPAKPHVKEVMLALKKRGGSLHVLTGSPHSFLDPFMQKEGLTELFDNAWSVDDFPVNKANPEIYRIISERIGVPCENCVMVDDSNAPLLAAKQAGWKTVGIYDEISKDNETEMRKIADRYIYDFEELL